MRVAFDLDDTLIPSMVITNSTRQFETTGGLLMRCFRRYGLLAVLAGMVAGLLQAETCLSPFVTRLDRPEKPLYVFCLDAAGKNHDSLVVVDVDPDSAKYGQVIHQLDLGSSGNETHHFGFTDDRKQIWGCSLFSNKI